MKLYNNKYDAYYDDVKNVWLEDVCGSKGCEYCSNRPSEPLHYEYVSITEETSNETEHQASQQN